MPSHGLLTDGAARAQQVKRLPETISCYSALYQPAHSEFTHHVHSSYFSTLGLINDLRSSKDPTNPFPSDPSLPLHQYPYISTRLIHVKLGLSAEEAANKENLLVLHLNGTVRISRQYN